MIGSNSILDDDIDSMKKCTFGNKKYVGVMMESG
jgi:hypothetical protein